jgi:hypothetical protein
MQNFGSPTQVADLRRLVALELTSRTRSCGPGPRSGWQIIIRILPQGLLAEGLSRREVARRLTETLGMPRNDAYRLVMGLP